MGVWCRTSSPAKVQVQFGSHPQNLDQITPSISTELERDNTARVIISDLSEATTYYYQLMINGRPEGVIGSFKTLPSTQQVKSSLNPKGLFNFKFEFGCGNNQDSPPINDILMPAYATMLQKNVPEAIDFAILNGDFIYEVGREFSVEEWKLQTETTTAPPLIQLAPDITGVWQNYKIYLDASEHLRKWHALVPSYYTIDDHEILNDVYGSGTPGRVDRKAVFRDTASQAWLDYIGWSNHFVDPRKIDFSKAKLTQDTDILTDPTADFTQLEPQKCTTLHVHWGKQAGKTFSNSVPMDDPNAGVYEIVEVLGKHQIRVQPPFKAHSNSVYSIGKGLFSKMTIGNCDIFMLDTRTYREMHNTRKPNEKGVSMLGDRQRNWLIKEMKNSQAEFFFVVSSVNFMVPHIGSNVPERGMVSNKDDAWTTFLDEREILIQFWDALDQPVFILSGDLHNSFAIKITDKIWEFASGPHNSSNHALLSEGSRPVNGIFQYGPRPCMIRWSTSMLNDISKSQRRTPVYCIVQINNVFNNPQKIGETRWVAYPIPQVIFQFFSGISGELLYSESILASSMEK
jgi:phosphodiesterase/alkaline phosphatase D-like protein